MKSKTSCFSKTIFRKNITHFWPIWSLLLIFYLFLLPFMEFVNYLETKGGFDAGKSLAQRMEESVLLPELTQMVINPTLLFLFSLIVAGALFSYLYTSRAAYTMHAFPVTRTSLFFSNCLSGLLFLWMPLLTGGLFGILMAAGCGYSYLDILFKGLLMAMGISFFFYNFHVLVAMCIGQLIALPIFAFILNFLFVGCKFILIVLFASFSYGLNGEYVPGKLDVLSPLYYMSGKIRAVINYSSGLDHSVCTGIEGGTVVAGYALAAVVLIVIAYLLYRRRHVERGRMFCEPGFAFWGQHCGLLCIGYRKIYGGTHCRDHCGGRVLLCSRDGFAEKLSCVCQKAGKGMWLFCPDPGSGAYFPQDGCVWNRGESAGYVGGKGSLYPRQ